MNITMTSISEASTPNHTKRNKTSLKMVCGAFYIPKEKHLKPQGDDAHFICVEKQTIGVADGVGSWTKQGVDAGEYARKLMRNSVQAIQNQSNKYVDPRKVLNEAYSNTNVAGSSTACILTLKQNHLCAVNVGDSGFLLIREGQENYISPIQQRSFNYPYQLGITNDHPSVAKDIDIAVKSGDVLVVGTDGLFDNLYARNIEDIVKMMILEGKGPEHIAWAIAEHAYYNSLDENAATPYTHASLLAGKEHLGGKTDDITVIVAFIVDK